MCVTHHIFSADSAAHEGPLCARCLAVAFVADTGDEPAYKDRGFVGTHDLDDFGPISVGPLALGGGSVISEPVCGDTTHGGKNAGEKKEKGAVVLLLPLKAWPRDVNSFLCATPLNCISQELHAGNHQLFNQQPFGTVNCKVAFSGLRLLICPLVHQQFGATALTVSLLLCSFCSFVHLFSGSGPLGCHADLKTL